MVCLSIKLRILLELSNYHTKSYRGPTPACRPKLCGFVAQCKIVLIFDFRLNAVDGYKP